MRTEKHASRSLETAARMKRFAQLIEQLDSTNDQSKVAALTRYFEVAPKEMRAAVAVINGRPSRPVTTTLMRQWAAEIAQCKWLLKNPIILWETWPRPLPFSCKRMEQEKRQHLQCIEEIIALKLKTEQEKKTMSLTAGKDSTILKLCIQ